jgi:hypothetical protein
MQRAKTHRVEKAFRPAVKLPERRLQPLSWFGKTTLVTIESLLLKVFLESQSRHNIGVASPAQRYLSG